MARTNNPVPVKKTKPVVIPKGNTEEDNEYYESLASKPFIPTGSHLLNLHLGGGWKAGTIINAVGDSSSGKTLFCLTNMAELIVRPVLDGHRMIFDPVEGGVGFNIEKMFSPAVAQGIHAPNDADPKAEHVSTSIESFYFNATNSIRHKKTGKFRPVFYVEDSMDALTSDKELEEFEAAMKAHEEGKDQKGSYGDGKAKKNSSGLRQLNNLVKESDSNLVIISQVRDAMGMIAGMKSRSGGRALEFYSSYVLWLSKEKDIKRKDKFGEEHKIGIVSRIKITKNRGTGRYGEVLVPIYFSHGMDDLQSCVDYLVNYKVISVSSGGRYFWAEHDTRSTNKEGEEKKESGRYLLDFMQWIEDNELEQAVYDRTTELFHEVEESLKVNRKSRWE